MSAQKFYEGKKVLVTGGLGFLGSNLALSLVRQGAKVTLLDCLLDRHGGNEFNFSEISKEALWVKGDIRDEAVVGKLVPGQDVIFNIAAQTSHTDSMEHPLLDAEINTKGQINILEACRRTNPSVRLVYCSTRAVYGSSDRKIITEDTPLNPLDIYSVHKLAGEHYHKIYGTVFGLNATILRVANGYGPRAQMKHPSFGILNWFTRLAIDGQDIRVFGDGKQVRDYAYVQDIVDAFLATGANDGLKGEVMNVASGKGVPLIDIVKEVVRIAGKGRVVHVPWPESNKKIDVGDFIADTTKIRGATGWQAGVPLETGLKETVGFYEKFKRHYW